MSEGTSSGTGASKVVLTNRYDQLGQWTESQATVGGATDFKTNDQYNAPGEVTQITQITQQQQVTTRLVPPPKRIDFSSNLAGERTSVTRAANLAGTQIVATPLPGAIAPDS